MEHTDGHFSGHFRRRRGSSGWSSECCEFYSICGEIYLGHNSDYCTTGGKKILNRSLGDDCTCWHHYTRQYFCIGLFGGEKAFPRQLTPQTCSCSTSPKWLVKVCVFIFNLIESKQKLSIWYWLFFLLTLDFQPHSSICTCEADSTEKAEYKVWSFQFLFLIFGGWEWVSFNG